MYVISFRSIKIHGSLKKQKKSSFLRVEVGLPLRVHAVDVGLVFGFGGRTLELHGRSQDSVLRREALGRQSDGFGDLKAL